MENQDKVIFSPETRILKVTTSSRKIIESIQILKVVEDRGNKIRLENGVLLRKVCLEGYHHKDIKQNINYYHLNSFII